MTDEKKDPLAKAIADLKQRGASSQPPQDVVNETLAHLAQAQYEPVTHITERPRRLWLWSLTRLAAAAVVLIAAGYALGRITAPKPDLEELRAALLPSLEASLEPAIRKRVVEETAQEYQRAMVAGYVRLRDELTTQYRADLDRATVQAFTASNTLTNQLLGQLVEAVKTSQEQDRQWVAAAFEQIEAKRAKEKAQLSNAILNLAAETGTELQRTKEFLSYLANTRTETSVPNPDHLDSID
jgi:hypothetical protein